MGWDMLYTFCRALARASARHPFGSTAMAAHSAVLTQLVRFEILDSRGKGDQKFALRGGGGGFRAAGCWRGGGGDCSDFVVLQSSACFSSVAFNSRIPQRGDFKKWAPKSKRQFCLLLPPADGWKKCFFEKCFRPACVGSKRSARHGDHFEVCLVGYPLRPPPPPGALSDAPPPPPEAS